MSSISGNLVGDIGAFLRRHDKVHVAILELQIAEVAQAVSARRADFGLCVEGSHTQALTCLPYRSEQLCLVVPAGHPLAGPGAVSFRDVLDYEIVDIVAGFKGSVVSQRMHREAAAFGRHLSSRLQVGTFEAAFRAVAEGLGGAVVPAGVAGGHPDLVEVAIADDWCHRRLVLCMRAQDDLDTPARLLLDSLAFDACQPLLPVRPPMPARLSA
jgi:DNA-binding transcriptional LysR family regulator